MKYNDYILLPLKKNVIGKFMCYRPDRNKAIVEIDNKLSTHDIDAVVKATVKDVTNYFNFNIRRANRAIKEDNDEIKGLNTKLAFIKTKLHTLRLAANAVNDQVLQLSTALQLLGEDNYDLEMDKSLKEFSLEAGKLSCDIRDCNHSIEYLEEQISLTNDNKKEWLAVRSKWKEEKKNYLEVLKNG